MPTINEFKHGKNLQIGKYNHIHPDVEVGDDVTIRSYVELRNGTIIGDRCYIDSGVKSSGQCKIGNDVTIRYDAIIARNVIIEDGVFISPQVMFINIPFKEKEKKATIIRKGAKIGTNATINDGVEVGEGVIIGAKAFVNRDCLELGVYIGNPARLLTKKVKKGRNVRVEPGAIIGTLPTVLDKHEIVNPIHGVELGDNVWVGSNTVIMLGLENATKIGNNVKIGALCNIGHDVVIEDDTTIINGVHIAGHAHIGKKSYIGMGANIKQRVRIGKGTLIGMGSNVTKDIPDNVIAYGNPCKPVSKRRHPIKHYLRMLLP